MIKLNLPPKYDYYSSLCFVYPQPEPTPELWIMDRGLFIFPVNNKVISISFKKDIAFIDTDLNAQMAMECVKSKLNINSYGLKTMHEGLNIAKKIGVLEKYPYINGFIPPRLGDPPAWLYSGLVKTIILQMLSYTVARRMIFRFVKAFGETLTYKDVTTYTFPKAERIYEVPEQEIKKRATVSMVKARAIIKVAELELDGRLKEIEEIGWESPEEAAKELTKIKGIGYWTAYVSLMAGLGVWHAQPIDRLVTNLNKRGINCNKSTFVERPNVAGYISVAILFGEEVLRGRYFELTGVKRNV